MKKVTRANPPSVLLSYKDLPENKRKKRTDMATQRGSRSVSSSDDDSVDRDVPPEGNPPDLADLPDLEQIRVRTMSRQGSQRPDTGQEEKPSTRAIPSNVWRNERAVSMARDQQKREIR